MQWQEKERNGRKNRPEKKIESWRDGREWRNVVEGENSKGIRMEEGRWGKKVGMKTCNQFIELITFSNFQL